MKLYSNPLLLGPLAFTIIGKQTLADEHVRSRKLDSGTFSCPQDAPQEISMNYKVEILWMIIPGPGCESFTPDYSLFGQFIHDGMVPGNYDTGMGLEQTEAVCVEQFNQDHIDEVAYTSTEGFQYRRQLSEEEQERRGLSGISLRARAMMRYFRLFKKCRFCFTDDFDQRRRYLAEGARRNAKHSEFGQYIYTDKDSYNVGEPITVGWYNLFPNQYDWIGIYSIDRAPDVWSVPEVADQWVWACGDLVGPHGQNVCGFDPADVSGRFQFGGEIDANYRLSWPLPVGRYAAFLIPYSLEVPYPAVAMSAEFEIKQDYFQNILALQQAELGVALFEEVNNYEKHHLGQTLDTCYSVSTFYPSVNFIPATKEQVDACNPAANVPDYFQATA